MAVLPPGAHERPASFRDTLWLAARRLRGHRVSLPACGGCGYSTQGLTRARCPECGADLTQLGIVTGASWRPDHRVVLALWTLTVASTAWATNGWLLANAVPHEAEQKYSIQLSPASQAYREVGIDTSVRFRLWPWQDTWPSTRSDHLRITLVPRPLTFHRIWLEVDRRDLTCRPKRYREAKDTAIEALASPVPLSEAVITRWMAEAGVDVGRADVREETAELLRLCREAAADYDHPLPWGELSSAVFNVGENTYPYLFPSLTIPYPTPARGAQAAIVGAWLLLWAGGGVVLVFWTRRRR